MVEVGLTFRIQMLELGIGNDKKKTREKFPSLFL